MQKNSKPIIAIDCDHVIVDTNEGLRRFVNEIDGETHTPEDYQVLGNYKRYWERVWGLAEGVKSDRFARFVAAGRMAELDETPGSLSTLEFLRDRYTLVMITARTEAEVGSTHRWIAEKSPDLFDRIIFMHEWSDDPRLTKGEICQDLGAMYLIDDNYDHCRLAADIGVESLLFGDYGWNRQVPTTANMSRVRNWQEVKDFFNGRQ
jgi:5'(3')-deoxyribonucleotidase